MLTVHLRVNDAATKQPTAVRLAVTGPAGEYYAPLGRAAAFPVGVGEDVGGSVRIGRENFAFIDGACEIPLPAGVPLRVRATKGPEYTPLDQTITLGGGQMAVRLEIEHWSDLAAVGWMSGDSRAHFVPPHAARLEAAAEDLAVVNLLAKTHLQLMNDGNSYPTLTNLTAFGGQVAALDGEPRVVVNTLNTHAALGSLGLLNGHRVVHPLAFGEPFDSDDWSLFDWSDQCRRKKGLVVWADAFRSSAGLLGGEALAAVVLGKVDAIEFDAGPHASPLLPWYYRLLNAGVRLPLVGGSGKESNRVPLGVMRTYARVREDRTYAGWVEAVRAGRTFVTNGPLLTFDVGDRVTAAVACVTAFEKLEVVADGAVIGSTKPVPDGGRYAARLELPPPAAGWVAARCVGGPSPLVAAATAFAHTSPAYLGPPVRDAAAVRVLTECLAEVRVWAETRGQYRDPKWRRQLIENCTKAVEALTTEPKASGPA